MEVLRDLFISGDEASRIGYTAIVLAISTILSGIFGLEREFNGHTAGLRTHIIIGVSATAIGILGMYYPKAGPFIWGALILGLGYISGSSVAQTGKDVKGITTS
ncbi:MAG: MgtC/SapB family protein, partial [Bacilli bacterium]|nr:MgtC/SapB family protein [Bacilli bacterium]